MVAINVGAHPGVLTERERGALATHPALRHALLAGSDTPALELAATVALTHHEHYDGHGWFATRR
jgi:putative two-component system response regulator